MSEKEQQIRICQNCVIKEIRHPHNYFCKIHNHYVLWGDTCKDWNNKGLKEVTADERS